MTRPGTQPFAERRNGEGHQLEDEALDRYPAAAGGFAIAAGVEHGHGADRRTAPKMDRGNQVGMGILCCSGGDGCVSDDAQIWSMWKWFLPQRVQRKTVRAGPDSASSDSSNRVAGMPNIRNW